MIFIPASAQFEGRKQKPGRLPQPGRLKLYLSFSAARTAQVIAARNPIHCG
jgi:hypothetical protein